MGRRAEALLGDIQLQSRSATERAEIADPLLRADALEDEGGPGIACGFRLHEIGICIEAFRGEADTHQALRCAAARAPEPPRFAGEGEMHLRRMRLPGARSGLPAADLDDPGQRVVKGGAPIEAVA